MIRLLRRRVTGERADHVLAWLSGVILLAACIVLVLLMVPQLDRLRVFGLGFGLGIAATVIAWQTRTFFRRGPTS